MAIEKPRTRLVNVRLSEEEFAGLQRSINESGARSLSDFCRNAILKSSGDGQQDLHEIRRRLTQLEDITMQLAERLPVVTPLKAQHGWASFGYGDAHEGYKSWRPDSILLLGTAIGAAVALLVAPESGARTRRALHRKGQDAADYVVDAGKELAERCENLYKRSEELVGEAAQELSEKYRQLYQRSKELVDEAAVVIRRAGNM
jgi:gas vesicle protein